jgi:hypothetical protein
MGWKETLQIVLFALSWLPVAVLVTTTVFPPEVPYPHDFSIYNEGTTGYSQYRARIEETGFTVSPIQSSMSVVTRYNGSAVLVISGPVRDFSIDAVFTIFTHLTQGGGVLIADDFGTANSSFYYLNTFLLQMMTQNDLSALGVTGFLSFTDGVLLDLDSYDISPKLPVIVDITPHEVTAGVSEIHLNWASTLTPTCLLGSPVAALARSTIRSWVESDLNETNPGPDDFEWAGILPVVGAMELPTGPGIPDGRLVAVSDPSIFINDMWNRFPDNEQLGMNIIQWLSHGDTESEVLFCEQLLAVPWTAPELFYGLFLGRALWLSTMPFIAPLYPAVTVVGIRKYLPDPKKPEVKSVSDVFLRRGQTYFSERMMYYRTEGNYARVVKMLYRKLRRDLRRKHLWDHYEPKRVWDLLQYKDPTMKERDFFKTIARIEEISDNPGEKIKESEMMGLFLWIKGVSDKLVDTKR